MNELVAIVEGETEQAFVHNTLGGHLPQHGTIVVKAVLCGRRGDRGGVPKWKVAREDIVRLLKERRYCTTMFDWYAMPADWLGRRAFAALPWPQRAAHVEEQMQGDVVAAMGPNFDPRFFVPYVQLHEFEALAFADVAVLAEVLSSKAGDPVATLTSRFQAVLDECGAPEAIDDGYETCPSRRIAGIVPRYRKTLDGPRIVDRLGLAVLRSRCPHLAAWLERLEAIGVTVR